MYKSLLGLLFFVSLSTNAQDKNDSLVTSIGWVLHQGDELELAVGSMPDGRYKFIQTSEAGTIAGDGHLPNRFSGKKYKIYKIKIFRGRQIPVIKLSNVMGIGSRFDVEIEGAIANGEVVVPKKYQRNSSSKTESMSLADELPKLKKLFDDGVLTKDEYEAAKKKLLQ